MVFDRLRGRFSEYWPHDDTPGFTDYPEIDISTHRSIAGQLRLFALGAFVLGLYATSSTGDEWYIIGALVFALLCLWAGDNLRLQALEWEIQLLKEGDSDE